MSGVLFLPFYAAIDGDGIPMAGAKMEFYQTGTTTPQATYTASDLVTPNTNPVVADADGLFPPIYLAPGPDYKAILTTAADVTVATRDPIEAPQPPATLPAIRSYLAGLTLSTAGSSTSFTVADGSAADSTNAVTMNLSAMSKNTNSWAAGTGNGSLDSGSIAINTWYHVHLIYRSDTGATDILISLSATSPTLPTNYTQRRRIGSMKTDGSGNWTAFAQDGDLFQWVTPTSGDINAANPGTSAVSRTLNVPTGVGVIALFQGGVTTTEAATLSAFYFSDLATADTAASATFQDAANPVNATGGVARSFGRFAIRTNTSAQIRSRLSGSTANVNLIINTLGWIDRRGRDA